MLTAAPAMPQTSEDAGAGPGCICTLLCVHKGHGDQEQRNPLPQEELQFCLPVRGETKHKYYRWEGERVTTSVFSAVSVAQHMSRLN